METCLPDGNQLYLAMLMTPYLTNRFHSQLLPCSTAPRILRMFGEKNFSLCMDTLPRTPVRSLTGSRHDGDLEIIKLMNHVTRHALKILIFRLTIRPRELYIIRHDTTN